MLVKDLNRLLVVVVPGLGLLIICARLFGADELAQVAAQVPAWVSDGQLPFLSDNKISDDDNTPSLIDDLSAGAVITLDGGHYEVFSSSTPDRRYFSVVFGDEAVMNPNILPHPRHPDKYIIVGQVVRTPMPEKMYTTEVFCVAAFTNSTASSFSATPAAPGDFTSAGASNISLACLDPPITLPVVPTVTAQPSQCTDVWEFLLVNEGPHDARVFYGPKVPYALFGSNSNFTCFGQWVQDLRTLVPEWGYDSLVDRRGVVIEGGETVGAEEKTSETKPSPAAPESGNAVPIVAGNMNDDEAEPLPPPQPPQQFARKAIELQRPPPYGVVEKNWFLFWDRAGDIFVHYDTYPKRSFARIEGNETTGAGAVGQDLAVLAAERDARCMAKYLPTLPPDAIPGVDGESIHQATNSLAVTLCRRADPRCRATLANTVIFTVIHHKKYHQFHGVYEPYVVAFRQRDPFELYGISKMPFWVHGKGMAASRPGQAEMFYVVSVNWKMRGQKYHGFLDDDVLVAFGIEDQRSGGVDVKAGELLAGLGLCEGT